MNNRVIVIENRQKIFQLQLQLSTFENFNYNYSKIMSLITILSIIIIIIIFPSVIPTPTEYFTVRSGQEMDLAPVIGVNFMCEKFFLYFSVLSWGVRTP